jgi:Helicase associated domain
MNWEQGMAEFEKLHKAMGHANIPINENNHTPIAKWIRAQRAEWKRFLLGKDSLLDLDKVGELQEIGFP